MDSLSYSIISYAMHVQCQSKIQPGSQSRLRFIQSSQPNKSVLYTYAEATSILYKSSTLSGNRKLGVFPLPQHKTDQQRRKPTSQTKTSIFKQHIASGLKRKRERLGLVSFWSV